jgi:hypothetical protein
MFYHWEHMTAPCPRRAGDAGMVRMMSGQPPRERGGIRYSFPAKVMRRS